MLHKKELWVQNKVEYLVNVVFCEEKKRSCEV